MAYYQHHTAQMPENPQGGLPGSVYQYNNNYHQDDPQPYASRHHLAPVQPNRGDYQAGGLQYNNMAGGYDSPKLGATFYPGGQDDFYMPEVVSPTPQRIMPEVPSNMQEGLAHLELESRELQRTSFHSTSSATHSPRLDPQQQRARSRPSSQSSPLLQPRGSGYTASYEHTNASAYQNINRDQYGGSRVDPDSPKFSPFPRPRDAGPNVPLSDEDKEEVLERARPLVLQATDPEMQLAWAQDALSWVEVASQDSMRQQSEGQSARPATPKVEHQLRVDALSIVNFLADQHHPKAEFMKGMWLEFGKFGYRLDKKEAFLSYQRASEKGYARAEYRIGMQYESSNNSAKAIEHYQKGVALKDSASNYRLGMMVLLGQHGMPQNYQQGLDLVRFAASTADENAPQGAYVYGMLLARELPNITIPEQVLPYDLNEAKLFIEKAAYLGFSKAQLKLAQAYELCQLSCEFEPALSLHYNALAARQGEAEADMAISKWFLCGYEGVFEKNEELAYTYAKRAAQTKMATAEFAMGYFYEIGMYVPVDLHESESWYMKAAEHGNLDALGRIESIRKNKALKKEDHEKVAISRIKSQYGSQRGRRPDRFKQKPAIMSSMAEDKADIPDPRMSYGGSGPPLLPRPVSTAPYPEDDMQPHASQPPNAPSYNQGLRPNSHAGPHADRPSSAFGIRPLTHASTESYGHRASLPAESMRPSTSMGNMPVPSGGSNAAASNRIPSSNWEPQIPPKYRDPSPGRAPTLPHPEVAGPMGSNQGMSRVQKPTTANINKPQPQPPSSFSQGYGSDPARNSQAQSSYGPAAQRRDHSANRLQRPERGSSMVPVDQSQDPSRASQRPTSTMSSQSAHSRYPSEAAPKKSGPSTFEEMGIPAGKSESDCVVM